MKRIIFIILMVMLLLFSNCKIENHNQIVTPGYPQPVQQVDTIEYDLHGYIVQPSK